MFLLGQSQLSVPAGFTGMVEVAKRVGRQLTVIVFDGESISPMCLLRELHSRVALANRAIHTARRGQGGSTEPCVLLPHMCTYIVKNEIALLDHIVVGHYWGSFSCRRCLAFAATYRRADEKAHCILWTVPGGSHPRARSTCRKAALGLQVRP